MSAPATAFRAEVAAISAATGCSVARLEAVFDGQWALDQPALDDRQQNPAVRRIGARAVEPDHAPLHAPGEAGEAFGRPDGIDDGVQRGMNGEGMHRNEGIAHNHASDAIAARDIGKPIGAEADLANLFEGPE